MSQYETLMARDGHTFNTYIAKPAGHARGAVVVLQEIFGLTPYICRRADHYAQLGYLAVAPALFDRIRRGLVLGYSPADFQQGAGYRGQISTAQALLDIAAAAAVCRHAGTVTVVGYCWGGRLAWAAASELPLQAAVCFYGSRIHEELPKIPRCPTLLHFGERDASIPPGTWSASTARSPPECSIATPPDTVSTTRTGRSTTTPRPARWRANAPMPF